MRCRVEVYGDGHTDHITDALIVPGNSVSDHCLITASADTHIKINRIVL